MSGYLAYIAKRLLQFVLVVFIGINLAYVITHATPIDPVEQSISVVTSFGNTAPEAIEQMRISLRELYGLEGSALHQYLGVLETYPARRFRTLDVGLPDTGLDADRPGAALDRRTTGGLDHRHLGARQLAGRARRLLPEKPRPQIDGRGRDGPASDPLLHSGAAALDRVRLPVAGASRSAAVRR